MEDESTSHFIRIVYESGFVSPWFDNYPLPSFFLDNDQISTLDQDNFKYHNVT